MPQIRHPRRGSMQFWPRKRAERATARIRTWTPQKDKKILGFAGYKVGMTHIITIDNRKNSTTKGMEIQTPVTILECPPLKIYGIKTYINDYNGMRAKTEILAENLDKNLERTIILPKTQKPTPETLNSTKLAEVRILAHTQPAKIGFKKRPEILELAVGGITIEEKLATAKEILGKEIKLSETFKEGAIIDVHSTTKGKGLQGPVKRFGVDIRHHKSEKTKRGPGSLGGWADPRTWTVAHAGQMGFHRRTEYNKQILKITTDTAFINPSGGFHRYGIVKNEYAIMRGSIAGTPKRIITFTTARRPNKKFAKEAPTITYVQR